MVNRFFESIVAFIKDVKSELLKITFPGRSETIGSTTVVVVFTLIISLFLAVVDVFLVRLLRFVI